MKCSNIQNMGKKYMTLHMKNFDCVPFLEIFIFVPHYISREYRNELYNKFLFYTSEEVIGSYFSKNSYFPS